MEIVKAVMPGLIELYRKWREFAIAPIRRERSGATVTHRVSRKLS